MDRMLAMWGSKLGGLICLMEWRVRGLLEREGEIKVHLAEIAI